MFDNLDLFWAAVPVALFILVLIWAALAYKTYRDHAGVLALYRQENRRDEKTASKEQQINDLTAKCSYLQEAAEKASQELFELKKNYAEAAQSNEDLMQLRKRLADIENSYQDKIAALDDQIKEKERHLADLDNKNAEYEKAQRDLEEYKRVKDDIEKQQAALSSIKAEIKKLEENKQDMKLAAEINNRVQEAFKTIFDKNNFVDQGNALAEALDAEFQRQGTAAGEVLRKKLAEQNSTLGQELNSAFNAKKQELVQALTKQFSSHDELIAQEMKKLVKSCIDNVKLEEENEKLRRRSEPDAFTDLYTVPDFLKDVSKYARDRPVSEMEALKQFGTYLKSNGYLFSERVIKAFHTTLKIQDISPLTVLAGLSGTGKTLLPTKYAEFFGMNNLVISVQPRWDSPQDLLGFYNYLGSKYQATDLSKALAVYDYVFRRERHLDISKIPYNYSDNTISKLCREKPMLLVLLDEMNLARTEYYFSEFLSKLELRRTVNNRALTEDKLINAEITIDVQNNRRLWVPENVIFVGTMNEDESTQSLADKVLDRSNVMRFASPDFSKIERSRQQTSMPGLFVNSTVWQSWRRETLSSESEKDSAREWITALNEDMKHLGRPFGIRVYQAINEYLANYPRPQKTFDEENEALLKQAMADQIEHKILPKLRGVEITNNNNENYLKNIEELVRNQLDDAELADAINSSIDASRDIGIFTWLGVSRVDD